MTWNGKAWEDAFEGIPLMNKAVYNTEHDAIEFARIRWGCRS